MIIPYPFLEYKRLLTLKEDIVAASKEQIAQTKEWDLLSYLQTYEPHELKRCGPNEYCTRTPPMGKGSSARDNRLPDGEAECRQNPRGRTRETAAKRNIAGAVTRGPPFQQVKWWPYFFLLVDLEYTRQRPGEGNSKLHIVY